MDSDEHRRILCPDEETTPSIEQAITPTRELSPPFTTPAGSARLEGRRRAGSDAVKAMADPYRVTPRLAWHPALRLHSSPNDAR